MEVHFIQVGCNGCEVCGKIEQEDGAQPSSLKDGDSFTGNDLAGHEPSNANTSWDFDVVQAGSVTLDNGNCGPVTPGPGCTATACKLTATSTITIELNDSAGIPGGRLGTR